MTKGQLRQQQSIPEEATTNVHCGRAISRKEIENMGKIILCMCVYNVYAYVYVCTLVCVWVQATLAQHTSGSQNTGSLSSLHCSSLCLLKRWPVRFHGASCFYLSCHESTAMTGARHHAQHDMGPGALHARPYAYLLSYLPSFVSLYLLLLFMDFMDSCRIYGLQSLNGGDTSGQGVIRWLLSCYEQYREYLLDVDSWWKQHVVYTTYKRLLLA